jgi:hypothetical protein
VNLKAAEVLCDQVVLVRFVWGLGIMGAERLASVRPPPVFFLMLRFFVVWGLFVVWVACWGLIPGGNCVWGSLELELASFAGFVVLGSF